MRKEGRELEGNDGGEGSAGKRGGWGRRGRAGWRMTRGHVASPCTRSLRCTQGGCLHSQDSCLERRPFFPAGFLLMQLREISIIMLHIAD